MRAIPTAVTAATAAALAALAMTVTMPAIGDDGSPTKAGPDAGAIGGPDEATIRACLKDHGATVPDGDGRVLKQWIIADHAPAETEALKACGIDPDIKRTGDEARGPDGPDGPDVATLRACLKDHGANVPDGDGGALKVWVIGSHTAAEKEALKACGMDPETKPAVIKQAGPCDGKGEGVGPVPGDAAKPGEPRTTPAEKGV